MPAQHGSAAKDTLAAGGLAAGGLAASRLALTDRLQAGRFLVIGRAGMDLYADPPGAVIEEATGFAAHLGGSAANIAVALVRAGAQAALLTRVSDDAVGRFVLAQLQRYGVDTRHLRAQHGEARSSLAVVETRMENTQSVIYRNGAADLQMTVADAETVDYAAYSAVVVTGTALAAEPSRSAVFRALGLARAAGLALILDLDYRPYSWPSQAEAGHICAQAAALCDMVVGNDLEFALLAGAPDAGLAAALAAARAQITAGAQIVIFKRGDMGAITLTPLAETHSGIFQTDAIKPSGAGDAFLGVCLASLSQGADLQAAVMRGSAAAAMVVARLGCAPAMPDPQELDHFLASHPGASQPAEDL